MDDIQKAIDEFTDNWGLWPDKKPNKEFQSELKSLLEQVASEQKKATLSRNDHALVTKNLTFNED